MLRAAFPEVVSKQGVPLWHMLFSLLKISSEPDGERFYPLLAGLVQVIRERHEENLRIAQETLVGCAWACVCAPPSLRERVTDLACLVLESCHIHGKLLEEYIEGIGVERAHRMAKRFGFFRPGANVLGASHLS
jgi:hypothetical protein